MAGWGRNAAIGDYPDTRFRFGKWSIILAILALLLVIASFVVMLNMPEDASESMEDAANGGVVVAYIIVAPLLHVIGFVLGLIGLFRSNDGKTSSVVGTLLNLALFGAGFGILYMTAGALTAFR